MFKAVNNIYSFFFCYIQKITLTKKTLRLFPFTKQHRALAIKIAGYLRTKQRKQMLLVWIATNDGLMMIKTMCATTPYWIFNNRTALSVLFPFSLHAPWQYTFFCDCCRFLSAETKYSAHLKCSCNQIIIL